MQVAALKLDELELASLRGDLQVRGWLHLLWQPGLPSLNFAGELASAQYQSSEVMVRPLTPVQEVSCSLNFDSHTGRGKLSLANPRYSGLRGDNLSGGFRWERDVVRLEKLVLQQQRSRCGSGPACRWTAFMLAALHCVAHHGCCQAADHISLRLTSPARRYEVQGEYTIPPNTPLPSSAADLALQAPPTKSAAVAPPAGRWRLQVAVPSAELQEIIPAARLLQSATSLSPAEYERAKAAFLQARLAAGTVGGLVGSMRWLDPHAAKQHLPEPDGCPWPPILTAAGHPAVQHQGSGAQQPAAADGGAAAAYGGWQCQRQWCQRCPAGWRAWWCRHAAARPTGHPGPVERQHPGLWRRQQRHQLRL